MSANGRTADVLVIGSGIAGGIAALQAASNGARVILVAQSDSASQFAQGGIVYKGEGDPELLFHDILKAGCEKNFKPAVKVLCDRGAAAVKKWLIDFLQIPFDTESNGEIDLTLEAAHQTKRILHIKDSTGRGIMQKLEEKLKHTANIERVPGLLVDLLISNRHDRRPNSEFKSSRVCGAYIFENGKIEAISAKAVILATGGFSSLFQHSTGPKISRGDGISAAHRAGARTLHLEYVQFHPTALYLPGQPRFLLTEALRGSGAKLLNLKHKSFVDELAARDVVARAIHEEMLESGGAHVWLDLRLIEDLEQEYPSIVAFLKKNHIDCQKELVPVVPAAHYTLGGVWTDLDAATSVEGLYAAGEVACTGVHGANRLASTSLLEGLVFGEIAGEKAAEAARLATFDFEARPWTYEKGEVDPALIQQDWQQLRHTLWNYVGLVRSERRLRRAERILVELRRDVESFYKRSLLSEELIGLRSGVLVAYLVLYAALKNRQSLGTHYLKEGY